MSNTIAVVVTYNRIKLLEECINALLVQTINCDILVVNNASTDGTEQYITSLINSHSNIFTINTGRNIGGAGGFSVGVKYAISNNYKYAWLMDDDTIPSKDCLYTLEHHALVLKDNFSFLSSLALWIDGKVCKMNVQKTVDFWTDDYHLINEHLVKINLASFVSFFANVSVCREVGLPIKEFFIYGDDWEYSLRMNQKLPSYIDFDSQVIHKMASNSNAGIIDCDKNRIERCYYNIRNQYYIYKKYFGRAKVLKFTLSSIGEIFTILSKSKSYKGKRIATEIKGIFSGLSFNPDIEMCATNK